MQRFFTALLVALTAHSTGAMPLEVVPGDLGSFALGVRLNLDGQERTFQLDTGADSTVVAFDAQTAAYPALGKRSGRGASGRLIECDLIRPEDLRLDELTFPSPQLRRCDFGPHSLNILGMDILSGLILHLEPRRESLHLLERIPANTPMFPLERLPQGHARVRLRMAEEGFGAIFDTGAQLTSVDRPFAESRPDLFRRIGEITSGRDLGGNPIQATLYEIRRLKVGAREFRDVTALAFDFQDLRAYLGADTPLILGNNVITQADWILDLREQRWAILD